MADSKKKKTSANSKQSGSFTQTRSEAPEFLGQSKVEETTVDDRAVGFLEVYGLVCAFMAADAGCKAANVTLEPFDKNKPANADTLPVPLLVTIKFRGSVSDVTAAVEAGRRMAEQVSGVVTSHIIPRPVEDTLKMLKICGFDTN
ncbi:MAG: BMC domain-containing protein [Lachnospiraceae bacterium]|nr:BMC domain-containing protein [Lachnospiraceae bacterium]